MQEKESLNSSLPEERRRQISLWLELEGRVEAIDLSQRLDVSVDTIRRDLRDMDRVGVLSRVHGGALPRSPEAIPYRLNAARKKPGRLAIAKEAAGLVENGQIALIDGGTTCAEIARSLPLDLSATVVTSSPPVLMALTEHRNIEVIIIGGKLDAHSMTVLGGSVVGTLERIRADVCFLGVCSLDTKYGLTTQSYEEAEVKRAMVRNSVVTVAVATAEKLGTAGKFVICPIDEVDSLITEKSVPEEVLAGFVSAGVSVSRA